MKLTIVIPALNEEGSVVSILERSLRAGETLKKAGLGLTDVEVILVNDGSRDKTPQLARGVEGVRVVDHPVNRGYGAAIKTGFSAGTGELVGFLDADGTCDPEFFVELIRTLRKDKLDLVCGSRMHPGSKMPPVRVLGNWLFRTLVNLISGGSVADVASGMRVMTRASLDRLYPLPDGLNFTPAMSVRAVLDSGLRMGEVPMPYEERVGRSKLSVVKDGFRFLGVILETAVTYRPLVFFGAGAAVALALALWALVSAWGGPSAPLLYYLEHHRLEDWMIFRIILVGLFLGAAAFLLALGTVAQSLVGLINRETREPGWMTVVERVLGRRFLSWGLVSLALAFFFNRRLLESYCSTGRIPQEFWVFPLVGSLCALVALEFIAFGLVGRVIELLRERERVRKR